MKSAISFSQSGSDIKGSWLHPPVREQEPAGFPKAASSSAIPPVGRALLTEHKRPNPPVLAAARLALLGAMQTACRDERDGGG